MVTAEQSNADLTGRVLLYLFLVALLPFFGTQFGVGNQIEQFPIIERLSDPGFAPGDFFLDSAAAPGQPRYYYSALLAFLTTFAPLEVVVHVLSLVSGLVLALATHVAARRLLGATWTGAAIAATLVLLNHGISIGNAGYLTFRNFQPASIAISTGVAGITLLALGRVWMATALFLFAAIMHPTLGAEVSVIGYAAVLLGNAVGRTGNRPGPVVLAALFFLAGLAAIWVLPNLGGGDRMTGAEFFRILAEFRAPHHYLGLEFPKRRWIEFGLFVAGTIWIAVIAWRSGTDRRTLTILGGIIAGVVGLCLLSLYFVDIAESRLWVTAQLFRMVLLAKWAGYLLAGWLAGRWLRDGQLSDVVLVAAMVLPSADAMPYALVAVLATRAGIASLGLQGRAALAATVPAVLVAAYYQNRSGAEDQTLRLAVAGGALILLHCRLRMAGALAATTLVAGFLVVGISQSGKGPFRLERFNTALTVADRTDAETRIALLARDIGPKDALWLIPPRLEQFRFVAGRAVVADFTAIPFEDSGLREWHDRMMTVFGETKRGGHPASREMTDRYRHKPALDIARDRYGADYAVLYADTPWDGDVLAQAGDYKVVKLAP